MEIRAYITCLAAYNNGFLHGEWVTLNGLSLEDIQEETDRILASSPVAVAEEMFVTDWEGPDFGEHPDWAVVLEYAEKLDSLHASELEAFQVFCDEVHGGNDATVDQFRDSYMGTYSSPEDWAEEFLTGCGYFSDAPDIMVQYFDFAAYARDCEYGGDVTFVQTGFSTTFVFRNNY